MQYGIASLLFLILISCSDTSSPPASKTTYIGNLAHIPDIELSGANFMVTVVMGESTYLYATGKNDDGISIFSIADNGALSNVNNIADTATLNLAGENSMTTADIGGTIYLFVSSKDDDGVSVFSVDENGMLTNVDNVSDDGTTGPMKLNEAQFVTTADIGGTTYLFVAASEMNDSGVSVFSVDENGQLTNKFNIADDGAAGPLNLQEARSMATADIGNVTYLFVAGLLSNGISVFSVDADGNLDNKFNIVDSTTIYLELVTSVTTAEIGDTTYLFASGGWDNGISVFSVDADGQLDNKFNIFDNTNIALFRPQSVTTANIGAATYLFVAGSGESGITGFSVAGVGQMTAVETITDDTTMNLSGVSFVTTADIGGTPYLFAAGETDNGISVFRIEANGKLPHQYSIDDQDIYQLDAATSLASAVVDDTQYLLAAGENSDGFNVFRMDGPASFFLTDTASDSFDTDYKMDGIKAIATVEVDGTHYVIAAGSIDDGFSIFSVDAEGQLTSKSNTVDGGTLNLKGIADVITVKVGGQTYIVAAGSIDNGISSFLLDNQGNVTPVNDIADRDNGDVYRGVYHLDGVHSLASATVKNTTYVFAAGKNDDGISTFSISSSGVLNNVASGNNVAAGNVDDSDNADYNLDDVSALATTTMGTDTYLFAASGLEKGISIFKVDKTGALINVDNISNNDNSAYSLDGVQALSTVTHGDTTWLMAASNVDDGVGLWTVGQDGKLTFVDSITDKSNIEYKLDGSIEVLPVVVSDTLYIYVAGYEEDAVNIFRIK